MEEQDALQHQSFQKNVWFGLSVEPETRVMCSIMYSGKKLESS